MILTISSIFCGADLVEEGKKAYSAGDYTQAIKLLTQAQKEDSTNRSYDDMIFLAYLHRGEEIYHKTRNLDAFEGNFQKSKKYLPQNPSGELKKTYSSITLKLAKAFYNTKGRTESENDYNFDHSLRLVKQALTIDSTNSSADSMLAELKSAHFQGLIDKGENLYKKAGRTRNADLYFTAEYYLKEALQFEPDNQKILALLNKIVAKTLPVLNYREGISLAVAGLKSERKAISMTLSIKNYTSEPVSFNLNNVKLVDKGGNSYKVSEDEMKKIELFGETLIKTGTLNQTNPSLEGIIAFDAPPDVNIAYIESRLSNNKIARKYFP
jgi:hypothetical protein